MFNHHDFRNSVGHASLTTLSSEPMDVLASFLILVYNLNTSSQPTTVWLSAGLFVFLLTRWHVAWRERGHL